MTNCGEGGVGGRGGGGEGFTPVLERKKDRRRGDVRHTATFEKAVMMTAIARSPWQLQGGGGGGGRKTVLGGMGGHLRDIAMPIDTDDPVEKNASAPMRSSSGLSGRKATTDMQRQHVTKILENRPGTQERRAMMPSFSSRVRS